MSKWLNFLFFPKLPVKELAQTQVKIQCQSINVCVNVFTSCYTAKSRVGVQRLRIAEHHKT